MFSLLSYTSALHSPFQTSHQTLFFYILIAVAVLQALVSNVRVAMI
jgi:hypothetical protein